MKKFSILGLCLFAGFTMSAQMDLMKDVERTVKSGNFSYTDLKPQLDQITQNAETKDDVKAWKLAGDAAFANYDALFLKVQMGQDVDKKEIGNSIIDGYNYMISALPLDTIVDAKGKVKTKESKKIVKTIAENYSHFNNAGIFLWEAQDYAGAYKAWDIYTSLPNDPRMAQVGLKADADTIVAQIVFNKALAAWQTNEFDKALVAFDEALEKGYDKKNLYDYAISVAAQSMKNDIVYALAADAFKLYGKEDSKYIQIVINGYIEAKEFDKATATIEEALALDPQNGELYDVMGIIYDSQKDNEKAMECYKKAIELNPEFARAQYNYGRKICEKAYAISDASSSLTQNEYMKIRDEQIFPLFKEAAEYLEKAYELDPDNQRDALRYLRNVYYNLGDETNLKRIENLQL